MTQYATDDYTEALMMVLDAENPTPVELAPAIIETIEVAPLTLATLNAKATEWVWSNTYRLRDLIAVGATGSQFSYQGRTGKKVHALRVSLIVEDVRPVAERKATNYKEGEYFRAVGLCNGNGQQNARINAKLDISDITCEKCRKALGLSPL